MLFSIIAVGNEVIARTIINTTTPWLMDSIESIGHTTSLISVVPDCELAISHVLTSSLAVSDIIVLTGGLGPTPDDLTKEAVAKFLKLPMVQSGIAMGWIKAFFKKKGIAMPSSNTKQAMIPEKAKPLKNTVGTAPGIQIEIDDKNIILLPGPPSELQPMWKQEVLPNLPVSNKLFSRDFYVLGMSESAMATKILPLLERKREPYLAPYADLGQVRLRISAKAKNENDFTDKISKVTDTLRSKLKDHLFDQPMPETLVRFLVDKNLSISTAESCTGGLIGKMLTDIPGVSACFKGSVIAYSNESKVDILGVMHVTLDRFGAVSEQVASEMAEGARRIFHSDIALSTTGIAGPSGGTDEKSVGLVYMGLSTPYETKVFKEVFTGDRDTVRTKTMMRLLWYTIEEIEELTKGVLR